jgi:hypothetical protein
MIDSVIFSLIYGPIAVTLFFAIEAGRTNEVVVVRVLSHKQRRFHRGCPRGRLFS